MLSQNLTQSIRMTGRPWHLWPEHRRHIQDFPLFHDAIDTALTLPSDGENGHALLYWPIDDVALPQSSRADPKCVSDAIALCIGRILPKPGDMFAKIQDHRFGVLLINVTVTELLEAIRDLDALANELHTLYPDHILPAPVRLSASFLRGLDTVEDALARVRCKLREPRADITP